MKILLNYLKPHKWLVAFTFLAIINQVFSLFDPMLVGKLIDLFANHPSHFDANKTLARTEHEFFFGNDLYKGLMYFLLLLVGTAMVSRIAKAFQDYVVNVIIQKFGASIFTEGLNTV
jgi:ATP-binding cassette subfamily B protein